MRLKVRQLGGELGPPETVDVVYDQMLHICLRLQLQHTTDIAIYEQSAELKCILSQEKE